MRFLRIVLVTVGVVYLANLAGMFVLQRQIQYLPSQDNPRPEAVGLTGVTVETLATQDRETLVAWYAPADQGRPTLLFLHGNGGEIGDRSARFAAYRDAGLGVLFLSWRGFGGSTGSPSEEGFVTDARTAYDWLLAQGLAPQDLAVVGESLGTGVAVQLAAAQEVGALVLGAPYDAAVEIAEMRYPWLPVRVLMHDQYRSIEHIAAVTAPTLILHGTQDRVIPYASGRRLYDATTAPTTFMTLEGVGHEALNRPALWEAEIRFLNEVFEN
ncbi:MAG: alpha/beta fold hydrolase [Pseudomonadota bacterium]